MKQILKRDGRIADFDKSKIYHATRKAQNACNSTDNELTESMTNEVVILLKTRFIDGISKVEDVQDVIEEVLIKNGHVETAKRFILYRHERTRVRESKTRLMQTIQDITFKDSKDHDLKRENANIDGNTAMDTMLKYGSETGKSFYLSHVIEPRFSQAHINGEIHIHDLDFYTLTMTCCQIDLIKLFKGGFSTGNGYLREPNDIRSYALLACIAIQSNQNDQHGGQSIPNFDYSRALGVKRTYRKHLINNIFKFFSFNHTVDKEEIVLLIESLKKKGFEARMNNTAFNKELIRFFSGMYVDMPIKKIFD